MNELTTTEAAALLSERGLRGNKGEPVKADTVKRWCYRGLFPGARHIKGSGRGVWLIPEADLDAFQPPRATTGR